MLMLLGWNQNDYDFFLVLSWSYPGVIYYSYESNGKFHFDMKYQTKFDIDGSSIEIDVFEIHVF